MTLLSSPAASQGATVCPACSAALEVDPRYVVWCPACAWNLEPGGEDAEPSTRKGRRAARRREADRARVERLYADVAAAPDVRPGRDGDRVLATALATVVHGVTLALLVLAVWMLVVGPLVLRLLGGVCLLVAVVLRPRLGKAPDDDWQVSRDQAPRLHGLVDRITAELGAPAVDMLRVTPEFNASYGVAGLRRRRILTLGLALWEVLEPQERVALLGHELGHAVNGDNRRSLWLRTATDTLAHWCDLFRPQHPLSDDVLSVFTAWLVTCILFVPRLCCAFFLFLLDRVTLRTGQRAEYLADGIAARIGSAEACAAMLEALACAGTVEAYLGRRAARFRSRPGRHRRGPLSAADTAEFWDGLKEDVDTVPRGEFERQLRLSARHMSCVDRTHPPTHLRIRLARTREACPPLVTCDGQDAEAIAAELSDVRARAARALLAGSA